MELVYRKDSSLIDSRVPRYYVDGNSQDQESNCNNAFPRGRILLAYFALYDSVSRVDVDCKKYNRAYYKEIINFN